jgi:hypothetical protein
VIDTFIGLPCLHTSPAMRHHVIAPQLSLSTGLTRLQLAVAAIRHVLMFLNVRRPQTRREQVASLFTVSTVRSLGRSLYSDHYERVASAKLAAMSAVVKSGLYARLQIVTIMQSDVRRPGLGGTNGFFDCVVSCR